MSLTYGFYNAVNHDRQYNALDVSRMFDGLIEDGIFTNVGEGFQVEATTGMIVKVNTGRCWFNHTWTLLDADYNLTVGTAPAASGQSRIDTVVIEVDSSASVRANSIKIVVGTASSSPVSPTLIDTDYVHQYPLADILIGANVTAITQSNITDRRGNDDPTKTPFVTAITESFSANTLLTQWNSQFTDWNDAKKEAFQDWWDELDEYMTSDQYNLLVAENLRIKNVISVTFAANGWTLASGVYSQTVTASGMKADANPILVKLMTSSMSSTDRTNYNKAYMILSNGYGETAANSVTMHVFSQPTTDITVGLKGI